MIQGLRLLLAWLLLAALPLQGHAAATMLFCGPVSQAHAMAAQAADHGGHDHHGATDAGGHDHAQHGHAAPAAAGAVSDDGSLPGAGHACGACAACCHGVAIAATPLLAAVSLPAQSHQAEPLVPVHSRSTPVPDKPPRG